MIIIILKLLLYDYNLKGGAIRGYFIKITMKKLKFIAIEVINGAIMFLQVFSTSELIIFDCEFKNLHAFDKINGLYFDGAEAFSIIIQLKNLKFYNLSSSSSYGLIYVKSKFKDKLII